MFPGHSTLQTPRNSQASVGSPSSAAFYGNLEKITTLYWLFFTCFQVCQHSWGKGNAKKRRILFHAHSIDVKWGRGYYDQEGVKMVGTGNKKKSYCVGIESESGYDSLLFHLCNLFVLFSYKKKCYSHFHHKA